jgi:hypothetical protein
MTSAKVGADDFIHGTGAAASDVNGLPRVDITIPVIEADEQDLPRLAAEAWAALALANAPPQFFRWGGTLARIERDDHGTPMARGLTVDRLRHHLARSADWCVRQGEHLAPTFPPLAVVRDLLARPEPPLPVLEAPAIPESPTPAEIARARELLLEELLGDFPFVTPADRAHAVAVGLSLFARPMIAGPVPMTLVEKSTPGTGASLLVSAIGRVALGREPGTMSEGEDEDEWRKRITATLLGAPALVWIDNLRRPLDSAALSAAITTTQWVDRILGKSEVIRLPVRCAWISTGNNPVLSQELARRIVSCRLDARVERPWERDGFRHPNLLAWIDASRPGLVGAFLLLVRAWIAAGRPGPRVPVSFGMFESWAHVIGGILTVAEIPGFLENRQVMYERADSETTLVRTFLALWWARHGTTPQVAADLVALALAPEVGLDIDGKTDNARRVRLGRLLGKIQGKVYRLTEDLKVRVQKASITSSTSGIRWTLDEVSEGPGGSEDSTTPPRAHARAR